MGKEFVTVAPASEIPSGSARVFEVRGVSLALCNVEGGIYAIDNICTHDDGPLGNGRLQGCEIECPRHGARFDVRDGSVKRMPAAFPVRTYRTRIQDGKVQVELEP